MSGLASLFADSLHEFRSVRTITAAAMFAAVSVVLGYFTLEIGPYLKIGFATISNQFVYCLFGPAVGACFGGMLDLLKYLIKPSGPYFPGFTLSAAAGGLIYGSILYQRPLTLRRVFAAELTAAVICNMLLGTLWLTILYGKGFFALLPLRVFKNLILCPVNTLLFYTIAKALENAGVLQLLKAIPRRPLRK